MNKFKHQAVALGIAMAISGTAYADGIQPKAYEDQPPKFENINENASEDQLEPVLININAQTNCASNPIQVSLDAGIYLIEPIGVNDGGSYDAWNAWGDRASCTNSDGCRYTYPTTVDGWINNYVIASPNIDAITIGDTPKDPKAQTHIYDEFDVYPDASSALTAAQSVLFSLTEAGTVEFFLTDSPCSDNSGGISLKLSQQGSEPPKTYEDGLEEGIAKCQNDPASCGITVPPESGNCPRVDTHASFSPSDGVLIIPAVDVPDIFGGVRTYRAEMSLNPGEGLVFSVTTAEPIQ
jgi:hypothetical protein